MAILQYLAMTAAEMNGSDSLPPHPAWMACHFSPYSTGLCNLPTGLPPGSLLILNDRTPLHGHDPQRVCRELEQVLTRLECGGLLLDFQNPVTPEAALLARTLAERITLPLAMPPDYLQGKAAVFLPPVPTDVALEDYLARWTGREIWLEAALEGLDITLTREGCRYGPNRRRDYEPVHREERLHCHYSIQPGPEEVTFHTWRTQEDLASLLEDAHRLGVRRSVGLFQELG